MPPATRVSGRGMRAGSKPVQRVQLAGTCSKRHGQARCRHTASCCAALPCPLPRPPAGGASKIYKFAGADATDAFDEQHGPGSMQEGMLASYYLGDLVA